MGMPSEIQEARTPFFFTIQTPYGLYAYIVTYIVHYKMIDSSASKYWREVCYVNKLPPFFIISTIPYNKTATKQTNTIQNYQIM